MKVRQLIEILQKADLDFDVVLRNGDHAYSRIGFASAVPAEMQARNLFEFHTDEDMQPGGIRTTVFLVEE